MQSIDEDYMLIALEEAQKAADEQEVPVGAVLEYQGKILSRDRNRMVQRKDALAHAELLTLQAGAAAHPHRWLLECTLYVTLEPCTMCAGAMVLARVKRLVFATADPKSGACGSVIEIPRLERLNHRVEVQSGVLQEQASALLTSFFRKLRNQP